MKRAARLGLGLAAGALLTVCAVADPGPQRVHGVIKSFDGQYLTMKVDSGKTVVLGVQPDTRIVHGQILSIADIQPGDFVNTSALKGADGKLRAQGVRVLPATMHGIGEGLYTMASNPLRTIIAATVDATATAPGGGSLKLSFHGAGAAGDPNCSGRAAADGSGCVGTAELWIARGVPIVSTTPGDTSLLLPGAIVSAFAMPDATSLFVVTSITVERDGKPANPAVP